MEDKNNYKNCEYERIRMRYLAKNIRTLVKCLNKQLSNNEFDAIKGDILALIEDI